MMTTMVLPAWNLVPNGSGTTCPTTHQIILWQGSLGQAPTANPTAHPMKGIIYVIARYSFTSTCALTTDAVLAAVIMSIIHHFTSTVIHHFPSTVQWLQQEGQYLLWLDIITSTNKDSKHNTTLLFLFYCLPMQWFCIGKAFLGWIWLCVVWMPSSSPTFAFSTFSSPGLLNMVCCKEMGYGVMLSGYIKCLAIVQQKHALLQLHVICWNVAKRYVNLNVYVRYVNRCQICHKCQGVISQMIFIDNYCQSTGHLLIFTDLQSPTGGHFCIYIAEYALDSHSSR